MEAINKVEKIICSYITGFTLNKNNIDVKFDELGLDSMDVMGIFSDLESDYGIIVSDDDFHLYEKPSDICKLFKQ